jgi:hypothetical protein
MPGAAPRRMKTPPVAIHEWATNARITRVIRGFVRYSWMADRHFQDNARSNSTVLAADTAARTRPRNRSISLIAATRVSIRR